MRLTGTGSGALDVWVPGRTAPSVTATGLASLVVTPQDGGGFRLTAQASGPYTLSVRS